MDCSFISGDTITIDLNAATPNNYVYSGITTMTLPAIDTIDLGNISTMWSGIGADVDPFENGFPQNWQDFQDMCKEYPGLEQAFEKMKVFYKMCKDDWESKKNLDDN